MEEKLLIGITGASGAVYAWKLLKILKEIPVRVEVIITEAGKLVFKHELEKDWMELHSLAERVYEEREISAPPASGSAPYWGMIIIPCSMGTLGGLASGQTRNLLLRAGDVVLKERKPLVLVVRETPLNLIHLQNMVTLTLAGAIIFPAMPGFYSKPKDLEGLIESFVTRLLSFLKLKDYTHQWQGLEDD